jgi:hypothetical protein
MMRFFPMRFANSICHDFSEIPLHWYLRCADLTDHIIEFMRTGVVSINYGSVSLSISGKLEEG